MCAQTPGKTGGKNSGYCFPTDKVLTPSNHIEEYNRRLWVEDLYCYPEEFKSITYLKICLLFNSRIQSTLSEDRTPHWKACVLWFSALCSLILASIFWFEYFVLLGHFFVPFVFVEGGTYQFVAAIWLYTFKCNCSFNVLFNLQLHILLSSRWNGEFTSPKS